MNVPSKPMQWSDQLQLGFGPMDKTHQAFVEHVAAVQRCAPADLETHMLALIAHLEAHFQEEDEWMKSTNFPAMDCHVNEHAAVLKSAHEVLALLRQGQTQHCATLARELQSWFPGHADYLDSALAHWMCKLRLGGKPVLFKRNASAAVTDTD